jgi:ubiquinone/menaquinone biosynthesis C-methylase UbiE
VTATVETRHVAGAAFDRMAAQYDELFTFSLVGRTQRDVVWKHAAATFPPGSRVLELNCGTGEDAMFLARRGVSVTACDASSRMIKRARIRTSQGAPDASIDFRVLPTERLHELTTQPLFDGVFSNFSGLNCVADLSMVFDQLAMLLRPGAELLLCLSTRFCVWEILHYAVKGNFRKAVRRCRGRSLASFDELSFLVYYPTIRSLRNAFGQAFRLRSVTGIGITVPPSYMESWMSKHPRMIAVLKRVDAVVCSWPLFRGAGDHMLLYVERV